MSCKARSTPDLYNASAWGRLGPVTAVYTEAAIPIQAMWSVAVPILLTDLLFPERRGLPYLGRVGLIVTGCWYAAGVVIACIEENPVSAGLVSSAELWPWSSAGWQAKPPAPPDLPSVHQM